MANFFTLFIFADWDWLRAKRLWMLRDVGRIDAFSRRWRALWLKGLNGIGDRECFGILRYAPDDSKNEQRQDNGDAARTAGTGGSLFLIGYVLFRVKHQPAVLCGQVFEVRV